MSVGMLLAHPAAQALGRALLNFLWQGSFLALLLWIVKMAAPAPRFNFHARAQPPAARADNRSTPAIQMHTAHPEIPACGAAAVGA